jgi:hypothetical protein
MDITSRTPARLLALLGAVLLVALVPAGSAFGQGTDNATEPEHVAAALSALNRGKVRLARRHLREAVETRGEPLEARHHARDALRALRRHRLRAVRAHIRDGAAVEHFTYAQRRLDDGDRAGALEHLREAERIHGFGDDARRAIEAVEAGDDHGAGQALDDALGHAGDG